MYFLYNTYFKQHIQRKLCLVFVYDKAIVFFVQQKKMICKISTISTIVSLNRKSKKGGILFVFHIINNLWLIFSNVFNKENNIAIES